MSSQKNSALKSNELSLSKEEGIGFAMSMASDGNEDLRDLGKLKMGDQFKNLLMQLNQKSASKFDES